MAALATKSQHVLTEKVHDAKLTYLEQQDGPLFKAIVRASSMSESNLWTDVIPRFGCRFSPAEFRYDVH